MSYPLKARRYGRASLLALMAAAPLLLAAPAFAQDANSPSDSMAVNVVRALVEQGVLTQDKADAIIAKASADTAKARAAAPVATAAASDGIIHAPYVPENVRAEIKAELKTEMTQQAKDEHWATPNSFPDWASRFSVTGDFRFRDENRAFDQGNATDFINFNAINNGAAFNGAGTSNPSVLNSTRNRNLQQYRARLGFNFQVNDQISSTVMIASGNDNNPISTTQTLGANFEKKSLWLDQAYLTYRPVQGAAIVLGRAPNPFLSTEVLWKQDDLQLDGVSAHYGHELPWVQGLSAYVTVGAFPLDYADNYLPNALSSDKPSSSHDKYLFAGQIGAAFKVTPKLTASLNLGYYDYSNVAGKLSSDCLNTADFCDTDASRPAYMQKGNTLFALRNTAFPPGDGSNQGLPVPQYFGLASNFRDLDLLGKLDYALNDRLHLALTGDYVRNVAYHAGAITNRGPVSNIGCSVVTATGASCAEAGGVAALQSGSAAWLTRVSLGMPSIRDRWDWNLALAYAHIDPDAVMDAFNDKDFRLGGTNTKGWILEGDVGLARNTWAVLKYLSADVIYGAPYSVDVLQFDINTRF